jgi:hypothetical protein
MSRNLKLLDLLRIERHSRSARGRVEHFLIEHDAHVEALAVRRERCTGDAALGNSKRSITRTQRGQRQQEQRTRTGGERRRGEREAGL